MRAFVEQDADQRFHSKVVFDDVSGCALWVSQIHATGYGQFWFKGRSMSAHRWAYQRWVGPLVKGLVIDHVCRVRSCVNPDHLRQVTHAENTLAPGSRALAKVNAEKTHCLRGHELSPDNIYRSAADDGRRCRKCVSIRDQKRRAAA